MRKSIPELFQGRFLFPVHMFTCKNENFNFFSQVSMSLLRERNLTYPIWFNCICACAMQFFICGKLSFTASKTAFFVVTFRNRKRWNRRIINGMQHVLGIGRTGRVFHLFHLRELDSWKNRNS